MEYQMTPRDFFKELIKLYSEAGESKFPNQNIFRGRNASVSSSLEDLFADFIAKNNPNKCTYYIDQPMKFKGDKFPKYPDIAIQSQDGVIEHLIDMKADLGWNRNGTLDFCSKWNTRIEEVQSSETFFKKGMTKEEVKGRFSENLKYHIVVVTSKNASDKKLREDAIEIAKRCQHVELYILSDGKHPNSYDLSQDELLKQIGIRPDEFKRLLMSILTVPPRKQWSDRLIEETRSALDDLAATPLGVLHMKNIHGGYGKMLLEDLVADKLLVKDKKSDAEFLFSSVDELIAAGWAID